MRVVVVGGNGVLGRLVVAERQGRGHDVAAASRGALLPPGDVPRVGPTFEAWLAGRA